MLCSIMRIEKECNVVEIRKFPSRDNTKMYYNAKLLCNDLMVECNFIPKKLWMKMKDVPRLTPVIVEFDITSAGVNESGNMTYKFRLTGFVGVVKSTVK